MVFFKNFNVDPARRQIFGNASAEKCIPDLRVRLILRGSTSRKRAFEFCTFAVSKKKLCQKIISLPGGFEEGRT